MVAAESAQGEASGHAHRAFAGFSFLWASATLFHFASFDKWGDSLHEFVLAATAVWLLARPSSVPRLVLLATVQLYTVALDLPEVSNHWLFTAFVNLTILTAWLLVTARRRSFGVTSGELLHTFAPVARMELVGLYFFVVLHKLNTDYFDPDTSCGAGFYQLHDERFPFLPNSSTFEVGSLYLTILAEAAIPMLLCTNRGRNLGILVALTFHTVIGFNPVSGFYNFSSMLYAMLFLFAPEDLASRFVALWRGLRTRALGSVRRGALALTWRTGLLFGALAAAGLGLLTFLDRALDDQFLLVWGVYSAVLISLFVILVARGGTNDLIGNRLFELRRPQLLWLPLLVVLNGLSPYLGLKTESSFAMFSNLRTEGKESNHLLVPAGTQIFGFQEDLVEVTDSSHPALRGYADRQELLPFLEFRRLTRRYPDARVSYVRDGVAHDVARIGDHPELSQRPWSWKLLVFRPVPKDGPQECRH